MKIASALGLTAVLSAFAVVGHRVASAATSAVVPDDASILDLLRPVYDALTGKQYALTTVLALIAAFALIKRFANVAWLHTDVGGSTSVGVLATLTALAAGLVAPGTHVTSDSLLTAFKVGLTAAGGYAFVKNILVAYIIPKLPTWAQTLLNPILFAFNGAAKPADVKLAEAIAAGTAAVVAAPAQGVSTIVGDATEVK